MFTHWMVLFSVVVTRRLSWSRDERDERGDVPGWVLITLMTAGIVMALWIVAEPKLSSLLSTALDVSGDPNSR
jgi:amino acid transporter